MTISTQSSSVTILGTGALNSFNFSFVVPDALSVSVIYTDSSGNQTTLNPSQYTLSINAPAPGQLWGAGGTVTYPLSGSPIAAGTSITISRVLPLTQLDSISNQGNFYTQVTEEALDTLCMQIQQVSAQTDRSLQFPIVDGSYDSILPAAQVRANKYLAFDSLGNVTVTEGSGGVPSNTDVNVGLTNFIISPVGNPEPPASGLVVSLPSGTACIDNVVIPFPAISKTLNDDSIYDEWLNADGTITEEIATPSTFTSLPEYNDKVHLWRIYTLAGAVVSITQMSNTYPLPTRPDDAAYTIDNFVQNFYLYTTVTPWSSGGTVSYGQLISNTNGDIYQVAAPVTGTTTLGTVAPSGQSAGAITNGGATLFYYSQDYFLGLFRYAPNNGIENYFSNIALRRVCHRTLLTGSPLGAPAGTTVASLVRNYIEGMFYHLIIPRVNSGVYLKGMKMIAGGYIWLCTTAGTASGSSPYSGTYTPYNSTVTDGTAVFLCIYASYASQQFFWMNVDRTFLVYRTPDSHDSYASTFFSLIARYIEVTGEYEWLYGDSSQPDGAGTYWTYQELIEEIANYNLDTQIANFLTYTFQNAVSPVDGSAYTTRFLQDNCESVAGFRALDYIYTILGDPVKAAAAAANVPYVGSGIAALYDTTYNLFGIAYGDPVSGWVNDENKGFYPYLNSQLFPEFYNIETVTQDVRNLVRTWVSEQMIGWWQNKGKDTFPQNMFGFMAARIWQDAQKAYNFVENTERYFLEGGGLIINEFAYYLDTKDLTYPGQSVLAITPTTILLEDVAQNATTLFVNGRLLLTNQTAAFTIDLPANCYITDIFIEETAGNAVTGGVKIGTTNGGTDVVSAFAVGANSIAMIPSASILKKVFSRSAVQTLYFGAVSSFNSANLTVEVRYNSL